MESMNYAQAVEHLHALGPELAPTASASQQAGTVNMQAVHKFDLAHMRMLCEALGNPHNTVPSVLIAGTNGKGSTAATLASILTTAGYRTGLYTSPHLSRVNERIQMAHPLLPSEYGSAVTHNGDGPLGLTNINDEDFARLYTRVDAVSQDLVADDRLPWLPSFFERLTAIAFLYFAGDHSVPRAEIMILEVGLGGRLDATNIVDPLICIITDIALDHQAWLGETIALIASEKAGILRRHGRLITLSQHPEANQAIGNAAVALDVTGIDAAVYLPPAVRNTPGEANSEARNLGRILRQRNQYSLPVNDLIEPGLLQVDSPLAGEHQRRNLALAIAAAIYLRNNSRHILSENGNCERYIISNAAIEEGIRNTRWPGRLEFVEPNLLLDVAHNPAGAWTLRAAISALPQASPRTLIFSCLRDKNLTEMAHILFPLFDSSAGGDPLRRGDHIILAPIANPRAADVNDLLSAAKELDIPAHAAPHLEAALAQARDLTPDDGLIIATGSVYLIGEIRAHVQAERKRPA
jgi:dihydrofolate synthase/folylpolyglutamate synthase